MNSWHHILCFHALQIDFHTIKTSCPEGIKAYDITCSTMDLPILQTPELFHRNLSSEIDWANSVYT